MRSSLPGFALVASFVAAPAGALFAWPAVSIISLIEDLSIDMPERGRRRVLVQAALATTWPEARLAAIAVSPVAVATIRDLASACEARGATNRAYVDCLECDGDAAVDAAALDLARRRVDDLRKEIDSAGSRRKNADAIEGAVVAARVTLPLAAAA